MPAAHRSPSPATRPRRRRAVGCAATAAFALLGFGLPPRARADNLNAIGQKLVRYQAQVTKLRAGIKRPKLATPDSHEALSRKLIDAEVAFGVGNYDDAAIMLYDIVEKHPERSMYDEALYYLAESLFQKGDYQAARTYFTQLVHEEGSSSKFYQQSLERLVQLTLKLHDPTGIQQWLSALQNVPASQRKSSVPYVEGKYAYFEKKYDDALGDFSRIPATSKYYFQARYFIGAIQVTRHHLGKATATFQSLVRLKPKNKDDKRILALSQMALGRIHYERDQPSQAIDRYLRISRHSPLFNEALYEVAWVYVKNKQFDKALRALDLLALSDRHTSDRPDVQILEGNLRIRRAQKLADSGRGNSEEEYAHALGVFKSTRKLFEKPHAQLQQIVSAHADLRQYLDQITGRVRKPNSQPPAAQPGPAKTATAAKATAKAKAAPASVPSKLSTVSVAWLRKQPDVKRVVGIETQLGEIQSEIDSAEATIARLDNVVNGANPVDVFPDLADRRTHAVEILDDLVKIRLQLTRDAQALVEKYATAGEKAQIDKLEAKRKQITAEMASQPYANLPYSERLKRTRKDYITVDQNASKVGVVVETTQAELTAVQKYLQEEGVPNAKPGDVARIKNDISGLSTELQSIRSGLKQVRRQTTLARDTAGNALAAQTRALRAQLHQVLDEEDGYLTKIAARATGSDRTEANQIASLSQKANSITLQLQDLNQTIDDIVESELSGVRTALAEEKANLAAYTQELNNCSADSRNIGGEVLSVGFVAVTKKFYQVLLRSDVGVVDVAWSKKEVADHNERRLTLEHARATKMLDTDYADIIRRESQRKDAAATPAGGSK